MADPSAAPGPDGSRSTTLSTLLVVGTGLIGTSIGMAASRTGVRVWLTDRDPARVDAACVMGAGEAWSDDVGPVDHAVVCVPPATAATAVVGLLRSGLCRTVSDVAGYKNNVQVEVESLVGAADYVGGHPMAGAERAGPLAARMDLFQGRPWVLTPTRATGAHALAAARELAERCGAHVVIRSPAAHDAAVAVASHLPQLMASALAARLREADDVELAGQGVRDMTRIADSDPDLWAQLCAGNARALVPVIDQVVAELDRVRADLRVASGTDAPGAAAARSADQVGPMAASVRDLIRRGNEGRARLPGKHGGPPGRFTTFRTVLPDRPGELARLLTALAAARVNVEELTVDHAPGQPTGVVAFLTAPDAEQDVQRVLAEGGWLTERPVGGAATGH